MPTAVAVRSVGLAEAPMREADRAAGSGATAVMPAAISAMNHAGAGLLAPTKDLGCGELNKGMLEVKNHRLKHFDQSSHGFTDVFRDTVAVSAINGVIVGARVGVAATAIPDDFVGDGFSNLNAEGDAAKYDLKREGIFGVALHAGVDAASLFGMVAGGAAGLCAGVVASPVVSLVGADTVAAMKAAAFAGGAGLGRVVAHVAGMAAGAAMAIPRALSATVKLTCCALGGLIGTVVGIIGGGLRGLLAKS